MEVAANPVAVPATCVAVAAPLVEVAAVGADAFSRFRGSLPRWALVPANAVLLGAKQALREDWALPDRCMVQVAGGRVWLVWVGGWREPRSAPGFGGFRRFHVAL